MPSRKMFQRDARQLMKHWRGDLWIKNNSEALTIVHIAGTIGKKSFENTCRDASCQFGCFHIPKLDRATARTGYQALLSDVETQTLNLARVATQCLPTSIFVKNDSTKPMQMGGNP
jgi:hypothetical protein